MLTQRIEVGDNVLEITISDAGGGVITTSNFALGCNRKQKLAIDGIESLILAHACAGIDITSEQYKEGVQTALDAIANNVE